MSYRSGCAQCGRTDFSMCESCESCRDCCDCGEMFDVTAYDVEDRGYIWDRPPRRTYCADD